jgi:hypothetical protein
VPNRIAAERYVTVSAIELIAYQLEVCRRDVSDGATRTLQNGSRSKETLSGWASPEFIFPNPVTNAWPNSRARSNAEAATAMISVQIRLRRGLREPLPNSGGRSDGSDGSIEA